MLHHFIVEEATREANIDGSFNFITCQDPDLDSRLFEWLNSFLYILLKFVLDGSWSDKEHIVFNFTLNFFNFSFSVNNFWLGSSELLL